MKIKVFTDGGARGNPGPAATGFVAENEAREVLVQGGNYLGVATNNQAEYQAVIDALETILSWIESNKITKPLELLFHLDSRLVVEQLSGRFKIKEPRLQQQAQQIHSLLTTHQLKAVFTHIPRALNARADALVNQVLDQEL